MQGKKSFILVSLCFCVLLMQAQQRPNIVIIMTDDMGYSDLGCYGSEIPTPNIDALAGKGIRFTQFYNTSRCCPTRASLMTGLFQHQTGVGQMSEDPGSRKDGPDDTNDWGTPGYRGYLNKNCVTMAEVLKPAGYHTYMTGKWHLGYHEKEKWPLQRGFEKYYGILSGASSYLKPQGGRGLTYMNTKLPPPASPYYTTDAFTDSAISFIRQQKDSNPFFLYLAYNAPHWPLQAKEADIKLFQDKYMIGWDAVRTKRYKKQLASGLIKSKEGFSNRDTSVRAWEKLSIQEKQRVAYRMAVYAAQVKCIDDNVGKLVKTLKQKGVFENTLIVFLSDNGACAEVYDELGSQPDSLINQPNYSGAVSYGIGWANVSNTPFRKWKNRPEEGGISAPLIMHWPAGIKQQNSMVSSPAYLIDLMPTVLEVTKATYPSTFHGGETIYPLTGFSLAPSFTGKSLPKHPYMYWEHGGNAAVRKGDWKMMGSVDNFKWSLYDLSNDRSELHDVAASHPELVKDLSEHWQVWAKENFVLPKRIKK